jgi:hypothetical protein
MDRKYGASGASFLYKGMERYIGPRRKWKFGYAHLEYKLAEFSPTKRRPTLGIVAFSDRRAICVVAFLSLLYVRSSECAKLVGAWRHRDQCIRLH